VFQNISLFIGILQYQYKTKEKHSKEDKHALHQLTEESQYLIVPLLTCNTQSSSQNLITKHTPYKKKGKLESF